jgi:hypothetical protein
MKWTMELAGPVFSIAILPLAQTDWGRRLRCGCKALTAIRDYTSMDEESAPGATLNHELWISEIDSSPDDLLTSTESLLRNWLLSEIVDKVDKKCSSAVKTGRRENGNHIVDSLVWWLLCCTNFAIHVDSRASPVNASSPA